VTFLIFLPELLHDCVAGRASASWQRQKSDATRFSCKAVHSYAAKVGFWLRSVAGGADAMLRNMIAGKIPGLPQVHCPDKGVRCNQIPVWGEPSLLYRRGRMSMRETGKQGDEHD
jgi:hypothetical protein